MKTERKLILSTFAVLLALSAPALRADDTTPPPPPAHGKGEGRGNPGHRLQVLVEKLNLTADQKAKIEPLIKAEIDEIHALMSDQSLTRETRREKMMAVNQKYRPQIAALLTPEQQAKFKELRQERREEMRERRQGDKTAKPE